MEEEDSAGPSLLRSGYWIEARELTVGKKWAGTAARAMVCLDGALTLVFGVGGLFDTGTAMADRVLEATCGAGMGIFAIALAVVAFDGRRPGDMRAWWALWYVPVFFALHVALLGVWVPDAVLLLLTAAALVAGRPSRRSEFAPAGPVASPLAR